MRHAPRLALCTLLLAVALAAPAPARAQDLSPGAARLVARVQKLLGEKDLMAIGKLSARPANSYVRRGIAWERKGEHRRARDDFAKDLESDPDNLWALNGVGWLSATCPEAPLRDGTKAVKAATRLLLRHGARMDGPDRADLVQIIDEQVSKLA